MKRILGLDILRTTAILLVVFMHSGHFLVPMFKVPLIGFGIRRFVGTMNYLGELGVELFFILSGFLIGGILIKINQKTNFNLNEIKNFWMRRWFRTLPNYLLFLLLNILFFVVILRENLFYPQYFLFLQNFSSKIYPFFKESWSLAIEEWFYLTLPIILFLVRKLFKNCAIKRILLISFISYFLLFLIIKSCAVFFYNVPETRGIVLYRLDTMIIGVFMSYLFVYHKDFLHRNRGKFFVSGIILFIILFVFLVASALPQLKVQQNYWLDKFQKILMLDLFGIAFAFTLPLLSDIKTTRSRALDAIITTISLMSYSLYLIHFSILDVLVFSRFKNDTVTSSILIYTFYFAVTFGLSYYIYRYFEIPMTKLRDKISTEE